MKRSIDCITNSFEELNISKESHNKKKIRFIIDDDNIFKNNNKLNLHKTDINNEIEIKNFYKQELLKIKYEIKKEFLKDEKLWCHAKNLSALESMLYHGVHCFWHETDKFTITSKGYIWTFPEEEVTKNSVIVHKGSSWKEKNYDCAAVCTDFIL